MRCLLVVLRGGGARSVTACHLSAAGTSKKVENDAMTVAEALISVAGEISDEEVVRRVVAGERELFELLMRRHNQRVYRAVRAILRNPDDTEDVMQQAYVNAYRHLHQFEGRAGFATWMTKIAMREAVSRNRKTISLLRVVPELQG